MSEGVCLCFFFGFLVFGFWFLVFCFLFFVLFGFILPTSQRKEKVERDGRGMANGPSQNGKGGPRATQFKNKKCVRSFYEQLRGQLGTGKPILPPSEEYVFLNSLCSAHPRWHLKTAGLPPRAFVFRTNQLDRKSICLMIVRKDGSEMDISVPKCLRFFQSVVRRTSGPPSADSDARTRFMKVARRIAEDDVVEARNLLPDVCALTGVSLCHRPFHIDHEIEFRKLVDTFLAEEGIDPGTLQFSLGCDVIGLQDTTVEQKFRVFHRREAVLRKTTPHANLARPRPDLHGLQFHAPASGLPPKVSDDGRSG